MPQRVTRAIVHLPDRIHFVGVLEVLEFHPKALGRKRSPKINTDVKQIVRFEDRPLE